jgi:hypothetical protein
MTNNSVMPNEIHEGRNVKRFREMLGIKQDALAFELGEDWNQKRISLLEQKETIEPAILQQVSLGHQGHDAPAGAARRD